MSFTQAAVLYLL